MLWSGGTIKKKSQINPVQATSIVALEAADAYLVTLHPNPLNKAIEKISEINKKMIVEFDQSYIPTILRLSILPSGHKSLFEQLIN